MKLKLDDKGNVVLQDGKPVYVQDDGKDVAFDAAHTVATIARLNGEAKGHRERAETAEGKLKSFEGIEDADAARKALDTVKNLTAGDLKTAAQVEEIKAAATKAAEEQVRAANDTNGRKIKELTTERDALTGELYNEKVGGAFSRSKFVADKVAVPSDMLQSKFGQHFKVEGGKVVGYDQSGNKLFSRSKPGDVADFDEAIEMLVDSYGSRDSILKGTGASGSGATTSTTTGGKKTVTRAQFNTMSATEQTAAAKTAQIID